MPSTSNDQLTGISTSTAVKAPVRVATTEDITLSGLQTIDGQALDDGDRVLVKDQTNAVENGIYIAHPTAWERAPDFDGARDVRRGTIIFTIDLTDNPFFYTVTTANPIVIGTSEIDITGLFFGGSAQQVLDLLKTVDGSGSGLDADLLDGLNGSDYALASRLISAAGLATGGGNLTADRTINVPVASEAEAAAGASNSVAMTPLRVYQAIQALGNVVVPAVERFSLNGSQNQITLADEPVSEEHTDIYIGSVYQQKNTYSLSGAVITFDSNPPAGTNHVEVKYGFSLSSAIQGVPTGRVVDTSGLATGGGDLTMDRTIDVPAASQAQAEAGSNNTTAMTPLRTAQAIAALQRGIASQAEAEAGSNNTKDMTPLRVAQAIAALGGGGMEFGLLEVNVFTSGGTLTKNADADFWIIEMVGGGSGGAGTPTTGSGQVVAGRGGGSGAYLKGIISAPPSSATVTIGNGTAGGAGVSSGAAGQTSVVGTGLNIQVGGGLSAASSVVKTPPVIFGMAGRGAVLTTTGMTLIARIDSGTGDAMPGFALSTTNVVAGVGTGNPLGCGGSGGLVLAGGYSNGGNASGFGAGGGGAAAGASVGTQGNGGNGSDGIVICYQYKSP